MTDDNAFLAGKGSNACENFMELLKLIFDKSIFQEKRLKHDLKARGKDYFEEVEKFLVEYKVYLSNNNIAFEYVVDSYVSLCYETMLLQIDFLETGEYPNKNLSDVKERIYDNDEKMKMYIFGMALSLFLWKTHYDMYRFFGKMLQDDSGDIGKYLEIGPGHGLYLKKAIDIIGDKAEFTAVDISLSSINITRSIMNFFHPRSKIIYINEDMLNLNIDEKYDFITMGEIVEHVAKPYKLLEKLRELLLPQGRVFISTAINSPMVDHLYHFKTVGEVRALLSDSRFEIIKESILPTEDLPIKEIVEKKIAVNYCAVIKLQAK